MIYFFGISLLDLIQMAMNKFRPYKIRPTEIIAKNSCYFKSFQID